MRALAQLKSIVRPADDARSARSFRYLIDSPDYIPARRCTTG